jgi:hypothetical protein
LPWRVCSPISNPHAQGPSLAGCPQLPSIAEVPPSIHNTRTCHVVTTTDPRNMAHCEVLIIIIIIIIIIIVVDYYFAV